MKKCQTCILMLFLTQMLSVNANNKRDLIELANKIGKRHSIMIYFDVFPKTTWDITYKLADRDDYESLKNYLKLLDKELSKYPKTLLKAIHLRSIVLAKSIAISRYKLLRTAIPDYKSEILILSFLRGNHDETYQKHVIHHELYHMIEEEFNGSAYWKDPQWSLFNEADFEYGYGGFSEQNNESASLYTHPYTGFVNDYATSGLEEDKAEIFATLFIKEEYNLVKGWLKKDGILNKKIKYIKTFLNRVDSNFNASYWAKMKQ